LSEEPALGCEPVALESESFPVCPPGPPREISRKALLVVVPLVLEFGSVLAGVKAMALRVAFGQP
jgi:hypothetical protein